MIITAAIIDTMTITTTSPTNRPQRRLQLQPHPTLRHPLPALPTQKTLSTAHSQSYRKGFSPSCSCRCRRRQTPPSHCINKPPSQHTQQRDPPPGRLLRDESLLNAINRPVTTGRNRTSSPPNRSRCCRHRRHHPPPHRRPHHTPPHSIPQPPAQQN